MCSENADITWDCEMIVKTMMKKMSACTVENRRLKSKPFSCPFKKLSLFSPKTIWKAGIKIEKNLLVKKKRATSPSGPETFLVKSIKFSSLASLLMMVSL
jgi:hypothetical protein